MAKKKAAKKRKASKRGKPPKLVYMISCDATSRDPNTEKESLYGVFERIWVADIPCVLAKPFAVVAKLKGGTGTHRIHFDILGPDKRPLPGFESGEIAVKCSPRGTASITVHIASITLRRQGTYQLVLRSDGQQIGEPCELVVKKKPTEDSR
jgi:hypothetical protein